MGIRTLGGLVADSPESKDAVKNTVSSTVPEGQAQSEPAKPAKKAPAPKKSTKSAQPKAEKTPAPAPAADPAVKKVARKPAVKKASAKTAAAAKAPAKKPATAKRTPKTAAADKPVPEAAPAAPAAEPAKTPRKKSTKQPEPLRGKDTVTEARRLSGWDFATWRMATDDPVMRSTIIGLLVLEKSPDWDRLKQRYERATRLAPVLRSVVVEGPIGIQSPRIVVDPNFDLSYHMRRFSMPKGSTAWRRPINEPSMRRSSSGCSIRRVASLGSTPSR